MATATITETQPAADAAAAPAELPEGVPYRLTAAEYFRMVEGDVIPTDRRVGLWKGQLYEKMAKKMPHSVSSSKVNLALILALPEGWCLWPENPILVDDYSAPLPDFSMVRGSADNYFRRNSVPKLTEIGLVVEVADTSLKKNQTETLRTYAGAGLPCYWVVNLVARRVEVYSDPGVVDGVARYAASAFFEPGTAVPLVLDGREIARIPAGDLLPVPEETH